MDPRRAQRLSEALREELGELIEYELSDPRLEGVSVTEVLLSPDGKHAHVRVSAGQPAPAAGALQALEHARHYLRRQLANRLRLFRLPELHFEPDTAPGGAGRVDELLEAVRREREKKSGQNTP